jgi:hypothetical protein
MEELSIQFHKYNDVRLKEWIPIMKRYQTGFTGLSG